MSWITDQEFAGLAPRNVFHRQLDKVDLPCAEHRNRHILFRRAFDWPDESRATLRITADDYYKLYVNGDFVAQGPAPGYPQKTRYNSVSIRLRPGRNVLAVHTLYQGLINRVWVSGDNRHGLWCELWADGQCVLQSDEAFLTHPHTGYTESGTVGYETQFLETYDSAAPEVGFERPDFDDSAWSHASAVQTDHQLMPQETKMLVFETIRPTVTRHDRVMRLDFGKCYVGYLTASATGRQGDEIIVRCAQELNPNGSLRYAMRCNCTYEEKWLLSGKDEDRLDWFDFKSFRYAELILPDDCEVWDVGLIARHYPFELRAKLRYPDLQDVWDLCVHTQQYGVQEVIQDCMDREKGFYVGDGCYTALTHMVLTGDDGMVRKLIDDAFESTFITEGMVTCLNCSMMQEIAEYPLILLSLMLWHHRSTGDTAYLRKHFDSACKLLDSYRRDYEQDGLLRDLDKWCVVEWPANFRDGYDVDITEGQVCHEPHVAINAYYLEAIRCANEMADVLGFTPYRDPSALKAAFIAAFYDEERHLFTDSLVSTHSSYVGNLFPFAFDLVPDEECEQNILQMIRERGIEGVNFFAGFPLLVGLMKRGEHALLRRQLASPNAWRKMLSEGATTTFESWSRDGKWNTSLFHLTFSFAAIFLAEGTEMLFTTERTE